MEKLSRLHFAEKLHSKTCQMAKELIHSCTHGNRFNQTPKGKWSLPFDKLPNQHGTKSTLSISICAKVPIFIFHPTSPLIIILLWIITFGQMCAPNSLKESCFQICSKMEKFSRDKKENERLSICPIAHSHSPAHVSVR